MRFRLSKTGSGGSKILSRDEVGPDEPRALFLGRLWARFGAATPIDDGFQYLLRDDQTGIVFTAYSGASGPSYGGAVSQTALEPVVRALEALLAATPPADCSLETSLDIDYGGGKVILGVKKGEPFEKTKKDRRPSPKSARTYEDCLAIAKQRGGFYGPLAGWQQCLEAVLPELPDELEIDGRPYDNCIGFGFSEKKNLPVFMFDEGPGIEEIAVERIPWKKRLPEAATLWLASYDRWRKKK
jgi:hypothetical protein